MCLARISIMPQNALMYTRIHSKLELDGVSWDFEAIIGIKPLEIGCHEVKGKRKRMGCEAEEERKQRNREWGGGRTRRLDGTCTKVCKRTLLSSQDSKQDHIINIANQTFT